MNVLHKKTLVSLIVFILVVMLVFSGCTATKTTEEVTTKEIKIGIIGPMAGWASVYGQYVVDGVKLFLKEHNYMFKDRPIKLYIEDTQGQTDICLQKFDVLKNQDKVNVIIGPSLGNEGVAAADWAKRNQDMVILVGYSAPEDLTMRDHSRNLLRPGWTGAHDTFYFGEFCAKSLGYKKIITVGQDYAYPWDQNAGFIRGFIENGGEEIYPIWHPVELLDFGSIMSQLQSLASKYDAVFYNGSGAQAIAFFKQWNQYGMDKYYPQVLGGANFTDPAILPELGPKAEGVYSSMHYVDGAQTPENLAFRAKFFEEYKRYPGAIELQGYDAITVLFKALEVVDGNIENEEPLLNALYNVKMPDSPRGPWYFDEYGEPVQNIYIQRTVKVGDHLMNVPVKTYIATTQFGPYKGLEKEYMSQPPNARFYPPGKRDEYMKEIEKYLGKEYVDNLAKNKGWTE